MFKGHRLNLKATIESESLATMFRETDPDSVNFDLKNQLNVKQPLESESLARYSTLMIQSEKINPVRVDFQIFGTSDFPTLIRVKSGLNNLGSIYIYMYICIEQSIR